MAGYQSVFRKVRGVEDQIVVIAHSGVRYFPGMTETFQRLMTFSGDKDSSNL